MSTWELKTRGWSGGSRRSGFVLKEGIVEDQLVAFRPLEVDDEVLQELTSKLVGGKLEREREGDGFRLTFVAQVR